MYEICLVEGEKSADVLAGHTEAAPYTPYSWRGGAASVALGDWSATEGRKTIVWPDADAEGRVAGGVAVRKAYDEGALAVRLVDVSGLDDKADAADLDADTALELLKSAVPQARPQPTTPADSNCVAANYDTRFPMHARQIDMSRDVKKVWAQLLSDNTATDGHQIYRRANRPVFILRWQVGPERKAKVEEMDSEGLLLRTSRAIFWHTLSGGSPHPAIPPQRFGILLLKDVPDELPELDRAVQWPLLTETGFLERTGYNADATVYAQLPPGLDCNMSPAAALAVWNDLIVDFPFEGGSDRAAALAAAITPIVRPLAPLAPLAAYLKPESQTGATLLARVTALIAEGEIPAVRPPLTWDHDEATKQLLTYARESTGWILIDNQQRLDHPELASMLTSGVFAGRQLGTNESLTISSSRFSLMVTANNIEISKELMNRTYAIRLDAQIPNPGSRTGFVHADLVAYARANRVRLLSALASLAKSWHTAGRPAGPPCESLAGFAGWRDTLAGILHHAGVNGFLENIDEVSRPRPGRLPRRTGLRVGMA